jgi:hypothetical protein
MALSNCVSEQSFKPGVLLLQFLEALLLCRSLAARRLLKNQTSHGRMAQRH